MSIIEYLARLVQLLRPSVPARTEEPARLPGDPARIVEPSRQPEPPRDAQ
jgi:hypothetical protein